MPNFWPRADPPRHHLPLTPPEFYPNYKGAMNYQSTFGRPQGVPQREELGYGKYTERYDQASTHGSVAQPPVYQQHSAYPSSTGLPSVQSYYEPMGAPLLPAMRVHERTSMPSLDMHRSSLEQLARVQKPKEEKPVGGVSSTLDYEMEIMTDFVTEMSQGLIQPGQAATAVYRKWVLGVLSATRLPSYTILLGMHYLSLRMSMMTQAGQLRPSEGVMHRMVTLGLLLGSKFLDDNTFINRSWSEVSGITVHELNKLEIEWLNAFDFKLHRDPKENNGFTSWLEHWNEYKVKAASAANNKRIELAPIDTSVYHQAPSSRSAYPVSPFHHGFGRLPTPEYNHKPEPQYSAASTYPGRYNPWNAPPANEPSPPISAPITGPTTPEYYSGNTWSAAEGYSRRTMFGFPPVSQPPVQHVQPPQHSNVNYPQSYQTHISPWNQHGVHCNCYQCIHRPSYFLPSGFNAQAVAS